MTELMMKMTFWLVAAMALGFFVAWLLSRTIHKRKEADSSKKFSALILEQKNSINKLEKNFHHNKVMLKKLSEELLESKKLLAEKTSLLTTLQNKLDNRSFDENNSLQAKEKAIILEKKIHALEKIDKRRKKELDDFGEIVLLAEEKIEENEKKHKNDIRAYLKNIAELKESLKLYEAYSSEPEFIISRDQFVQIEKQLTNYQKEIESLKSINKKSLLKSQSENFKGKAYNITNS